jgi:Na+/proline symporter
MQAVTSVIYVSAQVVALRTSFNGLFDIDPSNPWAVVVIFAFILLFEWVGGLASVALTDSVQGFIMVVSFVMTAVIVKINFGGWSDLDPQTFPKPQFYQTPTGTAQWGFWQFTLLNFSFFTFPHLIQRIYAAKDLGSLKVAFHVMNIGPWSSQLVSIFLGTVAVQVLKGQGGSSPFASIIGAMMNLGGFPEAVGVIAYTASLAAIMSTADSLVIAISQLITVEFIYPFKPDCTPKQITWYGRFVSLVTVVVALLIGIYWTAGISDLAQLQFPLTSMIIPPFLFGLFASERFDVHPWSMALGTAVSSIYIFGIFFGYLKKKGSLAIDAGVTGFVVNIVVVALVEAARRYRNWRKKKSIDKDAEAKAYVEHDGVHIIFADRPTWDYPRLSRFGDKPLTPRMLKKAMEGVAEPLTNVWFCAMFFTVLTFTTPIVAELLPPLPGDITTYFPATVNGMPWWAFKILMVSVVSYIMNAIMICQLPDEYPSNDPAKIGKEGIDVSLVELTVPEMGKRTAYDEKNELIAARRSTISRTMADMGIQVEDDEEESTDDDSNEDTKRTMAQRRLTALVLGQDAEISKDILSVEDGSDSKKEIYPEDPIIEDERQVRERSPKEIAI